ACGNPAAQVTQIITVDDTLLLLLLLLLPPLFQFSAQAMCLLLASLSWTDNCDAGGTVTAVDGPLVGGNCGGTITRTWNVTDACGNPAAQVTQIITVDDTTPPVIAAPPAAISVQCIGDVPALASLSWTDNCDAGGTVTAVDGPLVGGNCGGTITRTWNVTDACATQLLK
ncbi:MAG: hypothetical protein MZW92_32545, partial [Comamonadaceae bacterium]|nr:hypothetical protein [Comamonadaceae bacterium]